MIRYKRTSAMKLAELLEAQYLPLKTRVTAEQTKAHYRRAVRWLGEFLGGAATAADLTDDNLAGLMRWLVDRRGQAPATVNGTRKCLASLWRWCRDREIPGVRGAPTVAKLKEPERAPRAWRAEELERLVQAAAEAPGSIGGMPARTWWLTLLSLEMDTGARAAELLALRWEWIDWDSGTLTVDPSVRKGGVRFACYGLRAETVTWLRAIRKPEGVILGWDLHVSRYYQLWQDLLQAAHLPRSRGNQTHKLRRTFATLLERHGGNATVALGHASRATTLKSYLDPTAEPKCHASVIPFHPLKVAAS